MKIYVIMSVGDEGEGKVMGVYIDQKKAKADLKRLKKVGYGDWEDFYIQTRESDKLEFDLE